MIDSSTPSQNIWTEWGITSWNLIMNWIRTFLSNSILHKDVGVYTARGRNRAQKKFVIPGKNPSGKKDLKEHQQDFYFSQRQEAGESNMYCWRWEGSSVINCEFGAQSCRNEITNPIHSLECPTGSLMPASLLYGTQNVIFGIPNRRCWCDGSTTMYATAWPYNHKWNTNSSTKKGKESGEKMEDWSQNLQQLLLHKQFSCTPGTIAVGFSSEKRCAC